MNYIEQELKDIEEKKNYLQKVELMLKDSIVQNQIKQMYDDYLFYNDYSPSEGYEAEMIGEINYVNGEEKVVLFSNLYVNRIKEYEYLIDLCDYIGYDNDIRYTKKWAFKKDDWTFKIETIYSAKIPEKELELLELLGKVEVEIIPARKESRVFCRN